MHEIADLLKSPAFWFGSVIVGLIINLISAYLKDPLDKIIEKYSLNRQRMNAYRAFRQMQDIERMALDNEYLQMMYQAEMRLRFSAVIELLVLIFGTVLFSLLPARIIAPENFIGQLGVIGGLAIIGMSVGVNFLFAVNEARRLSIKLRAAIGLRWRINNHPFAADFDLLARGGTP